MKLTRLYPRPGETTPEQLVSGLDLGSRAPEWRPYVVCNMISTLDGKAAVDGTTRGLGGEADRAIFHNLRTQVDAIVVGATTANVERYGRPIKRDDLRAKRERDGLEPEPLTVIVSGRLSVSADLPVLQEPTAKVLIATAADHELRGVRADVTYERSGDDLTLLLARLRSEHAIRSAVCEGGPTLNSYMLAGGLIDELFLSTAARIVGGEAPSIVGGRKLASATRGELVWMHEAVGDLFSRWRLRP